MNEFDQIFVKSIFTDEYQPLVLIQYKDLEVTLTVADARKKAVQLIQASSISETEFNILNFFNVEDKPKGFGKVKPTQKEIKKAKRDYEMFAMLFMLIRDVRQFSAENIEPIYGANTNLPLVDYYILDHKIQLQIDECIDHAANLLEAAEAAECDAFISKYLATNIQATKDEIQSVIYEFGEFRKVNRLEELFKL